LLALAAIDEDATRMWQKATAVETHGTIFEQLARALPTPVRKLALPVNAGTRGGSRAGIWLKDDGATAESYGGNKVRKLAPLLADALRENKRRIVTFGAAGSHHVLCTALYARGLGLDTTAWLSPQPHTPHAERVLRCTVAAGVDIVPVSDAIDALRFGTRVGRDDYLIGPGGMGVTGTTGYFDAALELQRQVESGALPEPDWIVLATGSGSTAAGVLAGLAATRLRSRVLGVLSAPNPAIRPIVLAQALAVSRRRRGTLAWAEASARLDFDTSRTGAGYGHPIALGEELAACATNGGLELDPTYTAKAFAGAVDLQRRAPSSSVLFWNTLSSAPLGPLLERAPTFVELPLRTRQLLRPL
jgi:D-cysteine desulfhydrase